MLNIVCPCVGARQSPINTEPLGPNWAQKSQKDGKICIIRIDMVPSKYILPPYIVENTIPLLSSNNTTIPGLYLQRSPGCFLFYGRPVRRMALKYNGSRASCPASVFPKSAPSEGGNAVTVDQSCQLFPCLAHRAVVGGAADIIGDVLLYGENTLDREAFTFINRGEDG